VASKHALVGLHESLRYELDSIYNAPFVRTTLVTSGHLLETSMFAGIKYNRFARFIAPAVSAYSVADAIIDALANQESRQIAMPWYSSWAPMLRLLPSFVRDGIQKVRVRYLAYNPGFGRKSFHVDHSSVTTGNETTTIYTRHVNSSTLLK